MIRTAFVVLVFVAQSALAQQAPQVVAVPQPTAEELAFARLPADVRAILSDRTPAQAMQAVAQTNQQLIALGIPYPSPEQFGTTLRNVLNASAYTSSSFASSVGSASAGATTFPPLSPLVAPPPPILPPPLSQQR